MFFVSQIYRARKRYEVPVKLFDGLTLEPLDKDNLIYSWEYKENPFGLIIRRKSSNTIM